MQRRKEYQAAYYAAGRGDSSLMEAYQAKYGNPQQGRPHEPGKQQVKFSVPKPLMEWIKAQPKPQSVILTEALEKYKDAIDEINS